MRRTTWILAAVSLVALSCGRPGAVPVEEAETWAVTTWGRHFEVFAEVDPLVRGRVARSNTHVTVLEGFTALTGGTVSVVLTDAAGSQATFEQRTPRREGIFVVELTPPSEGEFELAFRVAAGGLVEEIPAGRVRVGSSAEPGGAVEPPKPPHGTPSKGNAQAVSFLKEQQWRTEFATAWVADGALPASVVAPARIVAPAGAEVILTAALDAVVRGEPWPHRGQAVSAGAVVFRLAPRVTEEKSLAGLGAEAEALASEATVARDRAGRLAELLKVEAASQAEVDRARSAASGLEARLTAARRDLDDARASRTGGQAALLIPVRAPWSGLVAEVTVSPGQTIAGGAPLARLLRSRPVWLEVAARPADAARLSVRPLGLAIHLPGGAGLLEVPSQGVRLVSRAPEVDARTGTLAVLFEIDRTVAELPVGSAVEAEVLLPGHRRGVVIPASALVDDGGVLVVYEQLSGEEAARREVRVTARQGASALVEGLEPGIRLVTRGAAAVRRASLLSSGAPEGHVH